MNNYSDGKKVLLIAGGGSIGSYTCEELLKLGHSVDVICLEDKISDDERLRFFQGKATDEFLKKLFDENKYDAIVDFLIYTDVEDYKNSYRLLIENTNHLIFLSSYRVYADSQHPITENAPRLYDVVDGKHFLDNENYAVPKSKCEDFLNNECAEEAWTIVRPVISFSQTRLDMLVYSGLSVLEHADSGKELILPKTAQNLTAGLDWAGNTGKLIANLLFKPHTFGKCYTISSSPNYTWGQVADVYSQITGLKVKWVDEETFLNHPMLKQAHIKWAYFYDRAYDRAIDNSAVLSATGLKKTDFKSIEYGIKTELEKLNLKK